jgi:protein-S-isoprenylcysteine O-methyltransferase Ste14
MMGGLLGLGRDWVVGELLGVVFCLLPALLIIAWTRDDRRLPLRVGAQVAIFGGLNLMVVLAVLRAHDPGWAADLAGAGTLKLGVLAQAVAVPGIIAAASVSEFRRVGKGTPFPYDPPVRLVVSGPYAYIANPMQLAMTAGFVILAAFTGAFQLAFAGVVAAAIAAGIARWHEGEQLKMRFGDEWERYWRAVRRWIPHGRPVWAREAAYAPSTLYISALCPLCTPVGRWIELKNPYGLRIVPAERLETPVRRALYLPAGASRAQGVDREGVAALAKALEHVNLAWAFAGWIVLFLGVSAVAQLIADAVGAGPRDLAASTNRA